MKRPLVIIKTAALTAACFTIFTLASCCKQTPPVVSCYDEVLAEQSRELVCTADCPGVIGCDGKTYCNECEAARQGIRVVK